MPGSSEPASFTWASRLSSDSTRSPTMPTLATMTPKTAAIG